jgi:hypothetical protein
MLQYMYKKSFTTQSTLSTSMTPTQELKQKDIFWLSIGFLQELSSCKPVDSIPHTRLIMGSLLYLFLNCEVCYEKQAIKVQSQQQRTHTRHYRNLYQRRQTVSS